MSKKQIEEMAKAMCGNGMSNGNCAMDDEPCALECVYGCCAETLYNAGYRKQSEWISVEERLPEELTQIIVHDEDGTVGEALYISGDLFEWVANELMAFVTHWMPLPDAPKGGEE